MRITHVSSWGLQYLDQYTPEMQLAREISTMGMNVKCLTYTPRQNSPPKKLSHDNLEIAYVPYFLKRRGTREPLVIPRLAELQTVFQRILASSTDVWHLHHPSSLVVLACMALASKREAPIVFHTHDPLLASGRRPVLSKRTLQGVARIRPKLRVPEAVLRSLPYHLADKIIALTKFERNLLLQSGFEGKKITVIPHGVNPMPPETGLRAKLQLDDRPLVLTVARFVKQKGHSYLIAAIPSILNRMSAHFLMIGHESRELGGLVRLAKALGCERNITFLTSVGHSDLLRAYNECDVFVLPSLYESFGMVTLEAMSAGKPVVVTDTGAARDIIEPLSDGVVVPTADSVGLARAIMMLLQNSSLREKIGRNAKNKVNEKYTWPTVAAQVRSVYEELLAYRG